jgi:hypothetical protein
MSPEAGPLIVSIVMLGGTLFSMVLHGYSGFIRDPEGVRQYRNGALALRRE